MVIKAKQTFTERRIKKGYSITGLAERMQVNPSVVFNMEHGKNVRPATAQKACKALNDSFDSLFIIED